MRGHVGKRGDQRRSLAPLSGALHNMRANIWRLPPGVRGSRHLERVQEEIFVVLEGTATLLLGDPPQHLELPRGAARVAAAGSVGIVSDTLSDVSNRQGSQSGRHT